MIMNREELINAALEHQSKFETCDGAGTLIGFTNGMHKQSYESFIAGAEWVLKEMSDHIRNNMSYNDKVMELTEHPCGSDSDYRSINFYCDDCPIGKFGTGTCTKKQQYSK